MNFLFLVMIGLSSFRLAEFVAKEDGIFNFMFNIRDSLFSSKSKLFKEIGTGLECMWCMTTFWSIIIALSIYGISRDTLLYGLSGSIIAMILNKVMEK